MDETIVRPNMRLFVVRYNLNKSEIDFNLALFEQTTAGTTFVRLERHSNTCRMVNLPSQ